MIGLPPPVSMKLLATISLILTSPRRTTTFMVERVVIVGGVGLAVGAVLGRVHPADVPVFEHHRVPAFEDQSLGRPSRV